MSTILLTIRSLKHLHNKTKQTSSIFAFSTGSRFATKMSQRNAILSPDAPTPIGPYSQAVRHGNTLYCSGQIGVNPQTRQLVSGQAKEQAEQAFKNLKTVIEHAGESMDQVVKVNIFITDFANFAPINDVMKTFFREPFPARSTVAVAGLPMNALVEIEAIVGSRDNQCPHKSKF